MMEMAETKRLHHLRQLRHEDSEREMLRSKTSLAQAQSAAAVAQKSCEDFDQYRKKEVARIYDALLLKKIAPRALDDARGKESHFKERLTLLQSDWDEKKRNVKSARAAYQEAIKELHKKMRALNKAEKILEEARLVARKNEAVLEDALIDDFAELSAARRRGGAHDAGAVS